MALSKKPVNGMKDILPAEMEIRDYVTRVIKDTYRSFGFTPIETPCMENLANLSNKQGGENEKLIFKVLKRGEKLDLENAKEEADVVDFGMRYDLTVPLSRFYSNNANDLPSPFKALQIGSVYTCSIFLYDGVSIANIRFLPRSSTMRPYRYSEPEPITICSVSTLIPLLRSR